MNRRQRDQNRQTAQWLANQRPCSRCGKPGLHYVSAMTTLDNIMAGVPAEGFWVCDDLYGPDGRRINP